MIDPENGQAVTADSDGNSLGGWVTTPEHATGEVEILARGDDGQLQPTIIYITTNADDAIPMGSR